MGPSSSTDKNDEEADEGLIRVCSCNYCRRKFFSWQALGGHQNAHKRERTVESRDRLHRITAAATSSNLSGSSSNQGDATNIDLVLKL
ncbi:hypothetical protein MKX01_042602 [Papaver californicum]|nr:hypothetical protein MKX01_042602 [Papaver californicum]